MDQGLGDGRFSLEDPQVRRVLDRLHREARSQMRSPSSLLSVGFGRRHTVAEEAERMKLLYLSLQPSSGRFAYLAGRAIDARRVVEFGTSFGVSTIYLAAAVPDNGGGVVVGSEFHPEKVKRARANLREAGLDDLAKIREGDAQETLKEQGDPVDLVLLDGRKELYLPILKMLIPHLSRRAVVLADNIYLFRRTLRPYTTLCGMRRTVSTPRPCISAPGSSTPCVHELGALAFWDPAVRAGGRDEHGFPCGEHLCEVADVPWHPSRCIA